MIKDLPIPMQNLVNSGLIFMYTTNIQGTMADLIILKKNPELRLKFIATPKRVPREYHVIRVEYWEKQFGAVKDEFLSVFSDDLSPEEFDQAIEIYHFRNMIAHAHVSYGRDYMLYRPHGGEKREQKLIEDLKIQSRDDDADPMLLKIELWRDDKFQAASDLISSFTEVTLKRIADSLGVPIGQIR